MERKLKATFLNILENLLEDELAKFKFQLRNTALAKEYNYMSRSTLDQASPVKLADLLIQYYGEEYSVTVTREVLIAINQRNLVEKLYEATEKRESTVNLLLSLLAMIQDFP